MRFGALLSLLILLSLADAACATMYLYGGADSSGSGMSYPLYAAPLSFPSFASGDNTTGVSSVLLRATIFRPEFEARGMHNASDRSGQDRNGSAQNGSNGIDTVGGGVMRGGPERNASEKNASIEIVADVPHPLLPLWSQYTFFLPFSGLEDWLFGSYDGSTSSIRNFVDERDPSTVSSAGYETQSVRQFALQDGYREGLEAHDDPARMGSNRFLDDDNPPSSPLL